MLRQSEHRKVLAELQGDLMQVQNGKSSWSLVLNQKEEVGYNLGIFSLLLSA